MPHKPKVFISHSQQDSEITERLVADLRSAGADVWVDTEEITHDDFQDRINAGLEGRDWLVLVQSPASLHSRWVRREVDAAIQLKDQGRLRDVIPIRVKPCTPADVPPLWAILHYYDATVDYARALQGVQRAIGLKTSASSPVSASSGTTEVSGDSGAAASQAAHQLRGPRLAIAIVLVCALFASGLGAFLLLSHRPAATAPVASAEVGQAFFVSSGQLNAAATQGINDEFQISVQGIPAPPAGESYYGWLLSDANQSEAPDVLLGKLSMQQGAIHYLYQGDSQHTNLLGITSRFLITEESATVTPDMPSSDLSAWRYYAQLPQTAAAGQKYSLLDHLRHLLASDPDMEAAHLHGGLNIWAFRDTQQVFQWALSARDDWNAQHYHSLRTHVISMLDYLDGSANVARDTPAGTPILADKQIARVGLLEFDPATQKPPGYLYHIALHLNGMLQSPGATQHQLDQVTQITTTLTGVRTALDQVRHDAAQLANMSDNQLAQPATLSVVNDMVTAATASYQGQTNAATNQAQDGMSQLYVQVQKLAMFSVTAYQR